MNFLPRPSGDTSTAAKIAAVGAVITGAWDSLQNAVHRLSDLAVTRVRLHAKMSEPLMIYLRDNFQRQEIGRRNYVCLPVHVRSANKTQMVAFRNLSGYGELFWQGKKPLHVEPIYDDGTGGLDLQFARGTFNLETLIQDALAYYNATVLDPSATKKRGNRFFIRHIMGRQAEFQGMPMGWMPPGDDSEGPQPNNVRSFETLASVKHMTPLGYDWDDLGAAVPTGNPFDHLSLTENQLLSIEEARRWASSGDWFRERGVPWKRGWLLYGPAGTGKTSIARALAQDLDIPIFAFHLASLNDDDLLGGWEEMKTAGAPVMALMEDIDAVFKGRKNVGKGRLSFDCLLNCLDGIDAAGGIFTVMTTNHYEGLDPALVRPGRIDRHIEFGPLSEEGRWKIAKRILSDFPAYWASTVQEGAHETGAAFQERCARLALELFWDERPAWRADATQLLEEA